MVKKIKYIFLIFFLFGAFSATLKSQDIQAIAVIVNDEVISRYDVNQRVRLILVTSGIPSTEENIKRIEEQAIKALIDEKIQIQEAIKLEVPDSPNEINLMLENIANFYKREVEEAVTILTKAMEPMVIFVVAAIVGTIVVSLYLPMFDLIKTMGGS